MPTGLTAKTKRNTKVIVKLLQDSAEVSMPCIREVLGYSASGARKIVAQLVADGIVVRRNDYKNRLLTVMVKLSANHDTLVEYLNDIEVGRLPMRMQVRRDRLYQERYSKMQQDGSIIHVMRDDTSHPIKVDRRAASRDYMVAAFFGQPKPRSEP